MKSTNARKHSLLARPQTSVWQRLQLTPLSPAAARALLKVQFSSEDHERMRDLSAKARAGSLTTEEDEELDDFERLSSLISILHSKARQALKQKRTAS